jgi:hypothetical protein
MNIPAWKTAENPGETGLLHQEAHRVALWSDPELKQGQQKRRATKEQENCISRLKEREAGCLQQQGQLAAWQERLNSIGQLSKDDSPVVAFREMQGLVNASLEQISRERFPDAPEVWAAAFYVDRSALTGEKLRLFEERVLPGLPFQEDTADFFYDVSVFFSEIGKTLAARSILHRFVEMGRSLPEEAGANHER